MKNHLILAAACALLLAGCAKTTSNEQMNNTSADQVLQTIMTRTSVRTFTDEPVSAEQTEQLLRAAMAAPTAVNKQPWAFVVINDPAVRDHIAAETHKRPAETATLLVAICGDMERALEGEARDYWIQDCSAAAENLLLAAHAMGLGGVWLGFYPIMERVTNLQSLLGLPSTIVPMGIMAIGHPAESPEPKDKWRPEAVHWNKW